MKRATRTASIPASDRLRDKLAETGNHIADVGHIAKEAVSEKLTSLRSAATNGINAGKSKFHELENGFEERIRARPVKYLLIAAGVGAVLGILFRRS